MEYDWFRSRSKQVEKLLAAVEVAINHPKSSISAEIRLPNSNVEAATISAESSSGLWLYEGSWLFADRATPIQATSDTGKVLPPRPELSATDHLAEVTRPYIEYSAKRQSSDFYDNLTAVKNVLIEIVEIEAPLYVDVAVRRVASAWGMTRAGSRVQEVSRRALEAAIRDKKVFIRGKFIYSTIENPIYVRRNVPGGWIRRAEEIAPEEIAAAVEIVLKDQIKLSHDDLLVACARVLGFERTGSDVRAVVQAGVELLVKNGRATQESGLISLK